MVSEIDADSVEELNDEMFALMQRVELLESNVATLTHRLHELEDGDESPIGGKNERYNVEISQEDIERHDDSLD
jgi:predicted nuclease with TOPRIM domain